MQVGMVGIDGSLIETTSAAVNPLKAIKPQSHQDGVS